jgi:surface protein
MNRTAFQIYGLKKTGIFQSTWNTLNTETSTTELATTATGGATWTGTSYALGYTHIPGIGNTASLTSAINAGIGLNYILVAAITSRTAGSVTINYGGTSNAGISTNTTLNLLASTTGQLTIIPTFDFDGKIVISLKNSSTPSNQLKLPLVSTGTYNFWVDWGDGTYDNITSWNQAQRIHTYAVPGTYTTRILGIITGWESINGLNQIGDRKKLTSVASWGKLKPSTRGFDGCSNMTLNTVNDLLDLSHLTTMQFMFANCTALTVIGRSSEWKTSTITSLDNCFYNSINFNSPLNGWDVSNATNLGGMFAGCTNFNQNLNNWNVNNVRFFVGGPIYSGIFGNCTNFNNGFASGDGVGNQLTWNINTTSSVSMAGMFANCTSFNANLGTGTTPWNVSNVTTFSSMFQNASNFNNGNDTAPINNWSINTASAVSMSNMFYYATAFNRYVNDWNVSQVTNMAGMFNSTANFNQNIGAWNVTKVTTFGTNHQDGMFGSAAAFNNGGSSDINNWVINTSNPVSMGGMFRSAGSFNQPIGNWNTSRVTTMYQMFFRTSPASVFNQNIGSWDVGNVTTMESMFANATVFNNGGSTSIDNWRPSSCTTMRNMFSGATTFNQPIGSWNVSQVTDMSGMFPSATAFNQDLSTWNTGAVTTMFAMFNGITAFNQNIGAWNVSQVANFTNFMSGKTPANFSSTNLDAIYNGWIVNGVKPNINISFGTAKYTSAGVTGRAILTNPAGYNWTITDGGNENVLILDAGNPLSYPGTGTTWTDLSGNNNNGTLVNGPTFDSANGGSIVFDGVNEYGLVSNLPILSVMSVVTWVKIKTNVTNTYIFNKTPTSVNNNNYGLCIINSRLRVNSYNGTSGSHIDSNYIITVDQWVNITAVYNSTSSAVYINGNLDNYGNINIVNSGSQLSIAYNLLVNSGAVNCNISTFNLYNKALTPTEILQNYNATKGRFGL